MPSSSKNKIYVQAENVNNTLLRVSYWTDKAVGGKSPKCFIKDLNIYIYTEYILQDIHKIIYSHQKDPG